MLPTILLRHINRAAEGTPDDLLDQNDFLNMFICLRKLIKTPRDCGRIGNALLTTYASVKGEVNFTDFVAMEVLRVCLPELHDLIRASPDRFSGIIRSSMNTNSHDELKKFHNSWLEDPAVVPGDLKDGVRDVVTRLFPKLRSVWGLYGYDAGFLDIWRRQCRAASPEILPTYFRLAVPSQTLSRQRTKNIVNRCHDYDALSRELSELTNERLPDGRTAIAAFLELTANLAEQISLRGNELENLLAATLNDRFVEIEDTSWTVGLPVDNRLRVVWLSIALLKQVIREERAGYLKRAIAKTPSVSAVVNFVAVLEDEHDQKSHSRPTEPLLMESQTKELVDIAVDHIERASRDETLTRAPMLPRVLWCWRKWRKDAAIKWFNKFIANDEGLLRMLDASTGEVRESSPQNPVPRISSSVNVRGLLEFIDAPLLKERLEGLRKSAKISDKQRSSIDEILKNLESETNGEHAS